MTAIIRITRLLTPRPDWQDHAACKGHDPNLWFPYSEDGHKGAQYAKAICRQCPVTNQCLDWAIEHREPGIWGGLSAHERRNVARSRITIEQQQRGRSA